MKCPFCDSLDNRVVDSRLSKDGEVIRRRRECTTCAKRFTTYERVEEHVPMIVKKDGRREPFDRQKVLRGLEKACNKRPISMDTLEDIVDGIEKKLQETGERELSCHVVGTEVMKALYALDHVAYVRFASVYREFKDLNQFMSELKALLHGEGRKDTSVS